MIIYILLGYCGIQTILKTDNVQSTNAHIILHNTTQLTSIIYPFLTLHVNVNKIFN